MRHCSRKLYCIVYPWRLNVQQIQANWIDWIWKILANVLFLCLNTFSYVKNAVTNVHSNSHNLWLESELSACERIFGFVETTYCLRVDSNQVSVKCALVPFEIRVENKLILRLFEHAKQHSEHLWRGRKTSKTNSYADIYLNCIKYMETICVASHSRYGFVFDYNCYCTTLCSSQMLTSIAVSVSWHGNRWNQIKAIHQMGKPKRKIAFGKFFFIQFIAVIIHFGKYYQ